MNSRRFKNGIFVLEGLNSFALTFFFYYFYFFMQQKFGFGNKANLTLAAVSGLIYVPASIWAGRFAQRAGYYTALKTGFIILIASLIAGWLLADNLVVQIVVMMTGVIGMCFTWPALEALISEGENYEELQHNIGIYNIVWAGTGALAYFIGGAILDRFRANGLYLTPLITILAQWVLVVVMARRHPLHRRTDSTATPHPHTPERTRMFMRMAWLANPSAYIAINTLVAVMPDVANRLELSTAVAGYCGSVWCFARLAAFGGLWWWSGWHYRFRWLLASFLALIITFAAILLVPNLAVVIAAEVLFGAAIGLIYYSSLFYSMDVGETKGEHGGIHEAAIGLGNFAGPAVGAVSLHFLPQHANSGTLAVSALLLCGLGGLLALRRPARRSPGA